MSLLTSEARDILLGIGLPDGDTENVVDPPDLPQVEQMAKTKKEAKRAKKESQKEKKAAEAMKEETRSSLRAGSPIRASSSLRPDKKPPNTGVVAPTAEITETTTLAGSRPNYRNPVIVGLYGISGTGKSYLLKQLSQTPLAQHLDFIDGSSLIAERIGLAEFQNLSKDEQDITRSKLMSELVQERRKSGHGVVIGGHLLFWNDDKKETYNVGTEADWRAYTHMVNLQVDPGVIYQRRKNDKSRNRPVVAAQHLDAWQTQERATLRRMCYERRITFTTMIEHDGAPSRKILEQLQTLLTSFLESNDETNLVTINDALATVVSQQSLTLHTMLVLDADKTLAPQDAGSLFWKFMDLRKGMAADSVDIILKSQGYSYESFRQVSLLYEEVADDFTYMCNQVATHVALYPEIAALLARVALEPHVGAVIVTCGPRQVWETIMRISGLTHVKVIGGGTLANGYVVTDNVKGHIVARLKADNIRVVAFGDSLVDVEMLKNADDSYVVVGDEKSRIKSMDHALSKLIDDGCVLRQVLLPASVKPRRTEAQLPIVQLSETTLTDIFNRRFFHATSKSAAKLLMTAMRNADISGHDLRSAHEEVGYYLANEYLGDILGVESYSMKHVTGAPTCGYRARDEEDTLIIPLMRGGEAMAFGVAKSLKSASFVHSKEYADIDPRLFEGRDAILLVDSVVNSGQSIMEYLVPLRKLLPKAKVVVIAGVVQAKAVEDMEDGRLGQALRNDFDLSLIALRKSENKYTGSGATDTGNRLFNTTYLP